MPEFFDYDPYTGLQKLFDYEDDTSKVRIHSRQDVQPLLDYATAARNERIFEGHREFQLACKIPPVVQIELRNKGIDIYSKDPTMIRRMFREIEANYPRLKTIDKKIG